MKGHDIAVLVGPPGKSSKKYGGGDEGDPMDPEEEGESADDEEAEKSAMEEFQSAFKGSPEEALKAYKQLRDTCG